VGSAFINHWKVFREAFSKIGEIRSFCSEKVPVLALSATIEMDFAEVVMAACSLSKKVKTIFMPSNHPNIRLCNVKLKSRDASCFGWLFKLLTEKSDICPKVLIYCQSQNLLSWLFSQFLINLGLNAYKDCEKKRRELSGWYVSC